MWGKLALIMILKCSLTKDATIGVQGVSKKGFKGDFTTLYFKEWKGMSSRLGRLHEQNYSYELDVFIKLACPLPFFLFPKENSSLHRL